MLGQEAIVQSHALGEQGFRSRRTELLVHLAADTAYICPKADSFTFHPVGQLGPFPDSPRQLRSQEFAEYGVLTRQVPQRKDTRTHAALPFPMLRSSSFQSHQPS